MIKIRPAKIDDAGFLFRLRNDPVTRDNSYTTDPVSMPDHMRWLDWNLKDQFVKLYISTIFGEDIGTAVIA